MPTFTIAGHAVELDPDTVEHRLAAELPDPHPRALLGHRRASDPLVEALRAYFGKWVAGRGDEVVVGADTIQEVVGWLNQHDQVADTMFRVPRSDADIDGAAPY